MWRFKWWLKSFFTPKLVQINYSGSGWIRTKDFLPEMFKGVLVYGTPYSRDVGGRGIYEARRWTGCSWEEKDTWEWCTPGDRTLVDVDYWMPLPPGIRPGWMDEAKPEPKRGERRKGKERRK